MTLREKVFESCDRAVENGYVEDFDGTGKSIYDCDPKVLADDTVTCDADLDHLDSAEVLPYVIEWQSVRRPR